MARFCGRSIVLGAAAACALAPAPGVAQEAAATDGTSFEQLAAEASTVDLGTLLVPYLDECKTERREIDRARCRGMRAWLRDELPKRSYVSVVKDADVVSVSSYDARVRGFKLLVSGCLACKQPVSVGARADKRFVTLREPDRDAENLLGAVEVGRASLSFDGVGEANQWAKTVEPQLRAEFVYAPTDAEWSHGPAKGFAFKLLGVRVFNHCTGEVVYSKPASAGPAERWNEGCDGPSDAADEGGRETSLPAQLSPQAINQAISPLRSEMEQCLAQFKTSATAYVVFVVPGGNGIPSSVTMEGPLGGTPPGDCVLEVARRAQFPRFARESQRFTYPIRRR